MGFNCLDEQIALGSDIGMINNNYSLYTFLVFFF